MSRLRRSPALIFAVALAAAPWILTPYEISIASAGLAFAVLAVSVHLHTHTLGLPTLGHAAPFGVGAYAAILTARHWHVPLAVQVFAAAAAAVVFAAATGLAVIRTRGITTIMITLAIAELVHATAITWKDLTGGTDGLAAPPTPMWLGMAPLTADADIYRWLLAVFAVAVAVTVVVRRSPYGRAVAGIGDQPQRMTALGYNVTAIAWTAHTLTGGLAGIAGGMWVTAHGYLAPSDLALTTSATALVAIVIGGNSITGTITGALIVTAIRDYAAAELRGAWTGHTAILLGVVFILCVYTLPGGLTAAVARLKTPRPQQEHPHP